MKFVRRLFDDSRLWAAALVGYWLALLVGTHLPQDRLALAPTRIDKLAHLVAFAVLGWLLAMTWQRATGRLNARHLWAAWLAIALFGAIDEWTQPLVGRNCSLADWLADALGAAAGLLVFAWMQRLNARE